MPNAQDAMCNIGVICNAISLFLVSYTDFRSMTLVQIHVMAYFVVLIKMSLLNINL